MPARFTGCAQPRAVFRIPFRNRRLTRSACIGCARRIRDRSAKGMATSPDMRMWGKETDSISVRPELQGRGICRAFLTGILRAGHADVSLCCAVDNPARNLYNRMDFATLYT